ncbi:hypothetical protein [Solimonas marina]|uniref:Outer membrane protein OmpA-like transmembrane domain-containing protein n=1 Tax=Solimonas marina TaxID=2714601 RepID=A0A969WCK1_9GAMM|nr:hypothetical protein [Solimonas marina]NKF23719.1 hypothetical protein [Solimonas marina]
MSGREHSRRPPWGWSLATAGLLLSVTAGAQALPAASAAAPARAWSDHLYLGLQAGRSQTGRRSDQIEQDLSSEGTAAIAGVDRSSFLWSLYGGYRITPFVAAELGYTNLGAYDIAVVSAPGTDPVALTQRVAAARPVAGDAVYLAMRLDGPRYRALHLQARSGTFYWRDTRHYEVDGHRIGGNRDGFGILLGASLMLDLGTHLSVGTGVELYRPTQDNGVRAWSSRIEWRF